MAATEVSDFLQTFFPSHDANDGVSARALKQFAMASAEDVTRQQGIYLKLYNAYVAVRLKLYNAYVAVCHGLPEFTTLKPDKDNAVEMECKVHER